MGLPEFGGGGTYSPPPHPLSIYVVARIDIILALQIGAEIFVVVLDPPQFAYDVFFYLKAD